MQDDKDLHRMAKLFDAQPKRQSVERDPAAEYTERTGRYLSLSERMAERNCADTNNNDNDTEMA